MADVDPRPKAKDWFYWQLTYQVVFGDFSKQVSIEAQLLCLAQGEELVEVCQNLSLVHTDFEWAWLMRRFDSRHGRMMKNAYIIGLENVSPRNLTRYCKLQYALIFWGYLIACYIILVTCLLSFLSDTLGVRSSSVQKWSENPGSTSRSNFLEGEEPFSHPFERSSPGLRGVRDVSWLSSALAAASNQASHACWCFDLKAEIWCATVVSFPLDSSFFLKDISGISMNMTNQQWAKSHFLRLIFCVLQRLPRWFGASNLTDANRWERAMNEWGRHLFADGHWFSHSQHSASIRNWKCI